MLLHLKDPLELFVKRRGISPQICVLSHCDMTYVVPRPGDLPPKAVRSVCRGGKGPHVEIFGYVILH